MVMPAIHLSRHQVAALFSDVTGKAQDAEIERLVKVARRELRQTYAEADMGISGANFAIAQTGTIGLVTNEGNARLVTTLPRVHVALVGLDKLLPSLDDALRILKVLPRNATGQALTSYVTWITGPNECAAAPEEKKIMHIVFLDNGRSALVGDPDFAQVLLATWFSIMERLQGNKKGPTLDAMARLANLTREEYDQQLATTPLNDTSTKALSAIRDRRIRKTMRHIRYFIERHELTGNEVFTGWVSYPGRTAALLHFNGQPLQEFVIPPTRK
jgi:hypothetical protein